MPHSTSRDGVFTGSAPDQETADELARIWDETEPDQHRASWTPAARKERGYPEQSPKASKPKKASVKRG